MRNALILLASVAFTLGGCEGRSGDPFRATGEVIAFGGGDAGPQGACATCHGLKGEGDGRLAPPLAGLDAGYLHRQLDDYHNGWREHAQMRAIVRRLTPEDRAKVSAYYAALPVPPTGVFAGGDLYAQNCASCHGTKGEGMGPNNPPLAGLSPTYIESQLLAWRTGKRRNDPMGQMMAVSSALSPDQVRTVSAQASALPGPHLPPAQEASR
ncbi:c-type cytochrome [Sphingomonas sp. G-3-2-10]|uniref:c-type cytochrome n=1 Tax=Sphingomonas sp. G-3-2-10 TaxID=2728838 RepID=UPI00146D59AD|nr:c-type cytochrome [Sphingomonas sp. G-3-2-10]NML08003.1 c-type cytochrome [Sphingomonas sp. G-3-2-10]